MSTWSTARDRRAAAGRLAVWIGLLAAALPVGARAQFGPHANAVMIPHLQPDLEYSSGQPYEGQSNIRACEDAIVAGPVILGENIPSRIFYVLVSVEDCPGPLGVKGVEFGFEQYDASAIAIAYHGLCAPPGVELLSLPTAGWPGPNEGISIVCTEDDIWQGRVFEVAWFAAYVYGSGTLPLGPNPPTRIAAVADNGNPPVADVLEEWQLGVLGFGTAGYNPCAPPNLPGACCLSDRCQVLSRSDCELQGGVFQGENTDCFPNPCLPPEPTTWGRLKRMYEYYK